MKPVYLEFCGINSFMETQKIDFSKLLEYGLFGIFGDTGSGKSTILDCIVFSLYGETSRSHAGKLTDLINDKSNSATVIFDFETDYNGARRYYRVEHKLKRGKTVHSHEETVSERTGGTFTVVCERADKCTALLQSIVGLTREDFEKCIALPQGEFAQFIKAQRPERLKLIARLFDLEAYGDALTKKLKLKYDAARTATVALSSRLIPYGDVSAESLSALRAEKERLEQAQSAAKAELSAAKAENASLCALAEKRREAEAVAKKLSRLAAQREEFDTLAGQLSRLAGAAEVSRLFSEGKELRRRAQAAEAEQSDAERAVREAEGALEALAAFDETAAEAEIELLSEARARAVGGAEIKKQRDAAVGRLRQIIDERNNHLHLFGNFRYEEEKAKLETALAALGSEDFAEYLDAFGKDSLFRKEYAAVAGEFSELAERHAEAAEDIAPLIEKYTALAEGPQTDFGALREAFEASKPERNRLRTALMQLEKRKGQYDVSREGLSRREKERTALEEELASCDKRLVGLPDLAETEKLLREKQEEKRKKLQQRAEAEKRRTDARTRLAAAAEKKGAAAVALEEGIARYRKALEAGGFSDNVEAEELMRCFGDPADAKARLEAFRDEFAAAASRQKELAETDCSAATDEAVASSAERLRLAEEANRTVIRDLAVIENNIVSGEARLAEKTDLEGKYAQAKARSDLLERLRNLLQGNVFMEFLAEEYLATVSLNASARLLSLTNGRYFLRYEKGFFVGDNFNGGERRPIVTLSGGETFLVSLSLALALSEEISKKSLRPIEFFFLDEGFGTLDTQLVDTVMDSLEKLRGEHFTIGIISHVEELKHRIDRKLTVLKATERSGSRILS